MSYTRVIPRDLFNESNLLKCYGQLALHFLDYHYDSNPRFEEGNTDEGFSVYQDESTGETFIDNLTLWVGDRSYTLRRTLNSREPWPLYLSCWEWDEPFCVFTQDGSLSPEMLQLISGKHEPAIP